MGSSTLESDESGMKVSVNLGSFNVKPLSIAHVLNEGGLRCALSSHAGKNPTKDLKLT
jgi:hypothetical protein